MAGTMRKMMEYLSFAEPQDEVYEGEVGGYDEPAASRSTVVADDADRRGSYRAERVSAAPSHEEYDETPARAERTERLERIVDEHRAEVTPINSHNAHLGHELRRIVTVHPSTYNEARVIGEAFRDGTPVIINLSGMGESDAKRMVDFAAGLVFGLHGAIERVTNRVFLLSPATVEIETEAGETDASGRFFNQS